MIIEKLLIPKVVEAECVIVIDVLRAFTTAAFAFAAKAAKIIPVSTVEEAFSLKKINPDYLLMGEVGGLSVPGFDFGNSPTEMLKLNLEGKTLVQRTSAGTQGIARSLKSSKILVASFVIAEATLNRVLKINPNKVTFVITGSKNGDEDLALAEYLEEKISNPKTSYQSYIQRVINSPEGLCFSSQDHTEFLESDLDLAIDIDRFGFAMEVFIEEGMPVIYPMRIGNPAS